MKKVFIFFLLLLSINSVSAQWELKTVTPAKQLNWVHFLDTTRGFIVGNEGSLYRTTNGGLSWQYSLIDSTYSPDLFCITFSSDSLGWISGRFGTLYQTTNGGSVWKRNNSFEEIFGGYYLTQIQFIDATSGWVTGSSRFIYSSSSGGTGWCVSQTGFQTMFQKIFMINAQIGFAAGSSGSAVKTTDGGTTWEPLQTGITETFNSIYFINVSTGFMIGAEGAIIKTTNGGVSWIKYPNSPKEYLSAIRFATDSVGWIVGANGSIYYTKDAGGLWSKESSYTTKSSIGLSAIDKNHVFAVGVQGIVMRYIPMGSLSVNESIEGRDIKFELSQSYPNPFNPTTTIRFTLPKSEIVVLRVFDMLGKEVKTLLNGPLTAGKHSVHFNAHGLSSGTYLCQLTAGAYSASQKMVLVK